MSDEHVPEQSAISANDVEESATQPTRKPRNKKAIAVVTAAAVLVGGFAAWGAIRSRDDVRVVTALVTALSREDLSVDVAMDLDADGLKALGATDADVANAGLGQVSSLQELTDLVNGVHIVSETLPHPTKTDMSLSHFAIDIDGSSMLQVYLGDRVLVLAIDVNTLTEDGLGLIKRKDVENTVGGLQGLLPQLDEAIDTLLAGQMVSVSFAEGTTLAPVWDELFPEGSSAAKPDYGQLINALKDSATVTAAGTDADGEKFDIVVKSTKFLQSYDITSLIETSLGSTGSELTTSATAELRKFIDDPANEKSEVRFRVWVKDDVAVKIGIDLSAIADTPAPDWTVAMSITLGTADFTIPENTFDLTPVIELLGIAG